VLLIPALELLAMLVGGGSGRGDGSNAGGVSRRQDTPPEVARRRLRAARGILRRDTPGGL